MLYKLIDKIIHMLSNYVLVKDDNKIFCESVNYYEDKSVYNSHYFATTFSSKDEVKNYNYIEHNYLRAGWYGEKIIKFASKRGTINFLKDNIKNKNEFRAVQICDLNLPEHDKVAV